MDTMYAITFSHVNQKFNIHTAHCNIHANGKYYLVFSELIGFNTVTLN